MSLVWCAADKKNVALAPKGLLTIHYHYDTRQKKNDSVVQRISVFKYEHGIEIRFQILKKLPTSEK